MENISRVIELDYLRLSSFYPIPYRLSQCVLPFYQTTRAFDTSRMTHSFDSFYIKHIKHLESLSIKDIQVHLTL